MSAVIGVMFFLTISILSQNGRNLPGIVNNIARVLNEVATPDTKILHKFKVVGEGTVIAVVSAQNNNGVDRIVHRLWSLGEFDINSQPIITYEGFARNLGVSDNLTQPVGDILQKEHLYWINFKVDYSNHTVEELLSIWKAEAEFALGARTAGQLRIVLFKSLAEREVPAFINTPDPDQLDLLSFQIPIVRGLGSDVRLQVKGLQFLEDYRA